MKKILVILLIAFGFTLTGCQSLPNLNNLLNPPSSTPLAYPKEYTDENLPQYSSSTIKYVNTTPKDFSGVVITLYSDDEVKTISDFYEEKLFGVGWIGGSNDGGDEDLYHKIFTKDNHLYELSVQQDPDDEKTIISIKYFLNEEDLPATVIPTSESTE